MDLGFKNSRTNFLSVSGILLLVCFQQFIFYYSLYYLKNVKAVLYVLILDVPLGLYIFFGLVVRSFVSSVRYSIIWCMYSVTILIKMILLAFMDESNKLVTPISGLSNESNDMLLSFFGLYVTPIVYSLFNSASKSSLFQDKNNVSVDELLHSDLGLSTTIDLWDLILMFSHLLKYYKVEIKERESQILSVKLFVIFIIFVLVTIFLLGLSIPTIDGDYKVEDKFKTNIFNEAIRLLSNCFKMMRRNKSLETKRNSETFKNTVDLKSVNESSTSLDMFTMAKFTFIIGFFLIDIPFLSYRLYILVKYNVFSLLLYKNFIFLFLRPYRLNMSQLAERDTAKGWQAAFFNTDLLNIRKDEINERRNDVFNLFEDTEVESDTPLLKKISRKMSIRKKKSQIYQSVLGPRLLSKLTIGQRPFSKSEPLHLSSKLFQNNNSTDFNFFNRNYGSKDDTELDENNSLISSKDYLDYLDDVLKQVDQHNYKMYVLKILRKSKILPIKSFPYSIIMRQWYHFVFGRSRNFETTYVTDINNFNLNKYHEFSYALILLCTLIPRVTITFLYYFEKIRSPRDIMASLSTDSTFMEKFVLEFNFVFSFIMFLFFLQTCKIFDAVFSFIRDLLNLYSLMVCLHSFKTMLLNFDSHDNYSSLWLLVIFLLFPFLVLFSLINNLIPYKNKSTETDNKVERYKNARKLLNLKLIYLLLKYSIGPITLNSKLCSLDLVEMFKIHDSLLHSQWSHFIYSVFFRVLCCSNLKSKSSFLILLLDLLFFLLYNTTSQSMRSLMFRKYEINFIVMRMLKLLKFDWDYNFDKSENSVTFADVDKYIKVQGLFSSPGIVIPPFM